MIFEFLKDVEPPVKLGTDIDVIKNKLFELEKSVYNESEQMVDLKLQEDCVMLTKTSDKPHKILKPAFDQLLNRAKIPLSYAYDIPFDMLLYNLERRCKQKNRMLLVRTRACVDEPNDIIRAILTERYNILQNSQCFHEFKEVICWASMSISESCINEKFFRVIASGSSKIDDEVATGLEMMNGETGWCSLELNTILKTEKTYMIVADTKNTTRFNLKMVHLQKDIKDKMQDHAKNIINNLEIFKTYVANSRKSDMLMRDVMKVRDRMDVVVGRQETRDLVEQLKDKNKFDAAKMLAEYADDLKDIEKQRMTKICAGSLIVS